MKQFMDEVMEAAARTGVWTKSHPEVAWPTAYNDALTELYTEKIPFGIDLILTHKHGDKENCGWAVHVQSVDDFEAYKQGLEAGEETGLRVGPGKTVDGSKEWGENEPYKTFGPGILIYDFRCPHMSFASHYCRRIAFSIYKNVHTQRAAAMKAAGCVVVKEDKEDYREIEKKYGEAWPYVFGEAVKKAEKAKAAAEKAKAAAAEKKRAWPLLPLVWCRPLLLPRGRAGTRSNTEMEQVPSPAAPGSDSKKAHKGKQPMPRELAALYEK